MGQAISVHASVQPDYLICLVCGEKYKLLKGHLRLDHRLTPAAYRELFGLPDTYPMMPSTYATKRRTLTKSLRDGQLGPATKPASDALPSQLRNFDRNPGTSEIGSSPYCMTVRYGF